MSTEDTNATAAAGPALSEGLGISAEVAELLRERDMYAGAIVPGLLLVRDDEGTALFQMTPGISVIDLRLMLAYAWKQYQTGVRVGQDEARSRMRLALGIDAERSS